MTDVYLTTATHPQSWVARFTGWLHHLAVASEARKTFQELDELDDHLLRDIGMTRDAVNAGLDLDTRLAKELQRHSPRIYL